MKRGLLTELRGCYLHALFIVDGTTGCSADEHLSPANQDWWIEITALTRAAGGCIP